MGRKSRGSLPCSRRRSGHPAERPTQEKTTEAQRGWRSCPSEGDATIAFLTSCYLAIGPWAGGVHSPQMCPPTLFLGPPSIARPQICQGRLRDPLKAAAFLTFHNTTPAGKA